MRKLVIASLLGLASCGGHGPPTIYTPPAVCPSRAFNDPGTNCVTGKN